jgi:ATP-dependent Lhr-like helicase
MERSTDARILESFHAPVRDWWTARFPQFSLPQRLAVPAIAAGRNTLVCAPTGTGKTLSAFISILSDLLARRDAGTLDDTVDTVYISPLRALGTDIARNLMRPLAEIAESAKAAGRTFADVSVRVAQRTGDTTQKERAAMVRRPPHILITTPESLALCLASAGMRNHLTRVRRIIIDELHALAPNKRGTDLMLSVERLADLVTSKGRPDPQRIGLSATIAPLERMAEYLVGADDRACAIADASFHRPLDLSIASVFGKSGMPFIPTAAINRNVYDVLEKTIRAHRTTLIFTNLRAATERVTYQLRKRFAAAVKAGEAHVDDLIAPEQIEAHHSSLDRDVRLNIERRLKAGELRAVVCSTSLELGIDIGTIDRVVLLNSPKGVARGLQRVGRSGHSLDATATGTFVPTVPADLLEAMVTADAMRKRQVDAIDYPKNPLDVLAQHLIGLALQYAPDGIHTGHAFAIIKRAAPYATLTRDQFDAVLRFVATQDLRDTARVDAKLWLEPTDLDIATSEEIDLTTGEVKPAFAPEESHRAHEGPAASPISHCPLVIGHSLTGLLHPLRPSISGLYSQNVGTITQEGQVKVRIQDGAVIGSVEEAFAQVLKPNDRFILGGRCVQVVGSKGMTLDVIECNGQTPTIPRWYSGSMSMEHGLAARMREFRAKVRAIAPAGEGAIARMLTRQYSVSDETAKAAAAYLHAQFRYADIPVDGQLLVERVPDEGGGIAGTEATVLVFHTMIGRAANEALARAVAYRMHKRFGGTRLEAGDQRRHGNNIANVGGATVVVDDYAFGIWVDATTAAKRADRTLVRSLLSPMSLEDDLAAAVETSDLFRTQFRYTAIRAHALLQNKFGRRRFIGQMQSYATKLYEALKEFHPDHLLLQETRRTVMNDLLNAPVARAYLESLSNQNLRLLDLASPSPFAFGLFAAGSARRDTLQLADTADFLLAMYEQVQRRLTTATPLPEANLFS